MGVRKAGAAEKPGPFSDANGARITVLANTESPI